LGKGEGGRKGSAFYRTVWRGITPNHKKKARGGEVRHGSQMIFGVGVPKRNYFEK